jgi:phage tail sheath protein FI
MALTSPGVEVTIIDESQYIPAATNSVPYILLATAQNKVSGSGVGVAAGTLAANANKVYLITSQRDLSATFGVPFFYKTTAGTPINGYELNEYGLLAAYSALGVSNRCYVQRVDVDLAELTATLVRPTGSPANGTYWLDTASSLWGIFEWNQTTGAFTNKIPTVITDTADLESGVPAQSIGSIGDYAVVATNVFNPGYYKRGGPTADETSATSLSDLYNQWVLVGSDDWKTAWPTIQGTLAPTTLTAGNTITVNDTIITVPVSPNNTVDGLADAINTAAITGVYAATIGSKLFIYADSTATNDGSTEDDIGIVSIANGTGTPLASLGITAGEYLAPAYQASPSYTVPRWRSTDTQPEPTGSVWQKYNNVNLGTNLVVKKYDSTLGTFVQQTAPVYTNDATAIYGLDPSGGGTNITTGSLFTRINPLANNTSGFEIFERFATGATIITGNDSSPGPFVNGNTFEISATAAGSATYSTPVTATLGGTGVADFLSAVSAAGVPYVSATVDSAGAIVFTHSQGGDIVLKNVSGTPVTTAGFNNTVRGVRDEYENGVVSGLVLSNWVGTDTFTYTASSTAPDQDPDTGRLWYYSATDQADIMIQDGGVWKGYQNVTNDVRGDDLTDTNATGPIFSATAPTVQTDGTSDLVPGDLWIDTSDLENYPVISRWTDVNGTLQWVQLDNTDQTTENGILFADARWAPNGTTNPITDAFPTITSLLTSDYLDIDAPEPTLYPEGILLFNTRRSGYNVKSFQADYFNSTDFSIDVYSATTAYAVNDFVLYNGVIYVCIVATTGNLPTNTTYWSAIETNAWVTASGNKISGAANMGRQAQRAIIVAALKAGIDSSTELREEQRTFNLIACPQYPELAPNMVALNNERTNTAFVVVDTPLRLTPTEVVEFATNNGGLGRNTNDGLLANDMYAGSFYPSCTTTDLSGSVVVQPPSHMMVRTIIRSDEVAFPWLAPAGTRRGVVDNATQIGYINDVTGEFQSLGVNQGLRDILYENRVNPITFVPGVGITNFGNKTTTSLTTSMDRINVARLVAFIRGRLETIAKQFLFEPNDQITRNEITNAITSLMIDLVAKRGIYDYLVVCDLTNNTPARIDRNELYVDIAIEPVKAVEFIYIPVRIKNTGEIASQSV